MKTQAVLLEKPEHVSLGCVDLNAPEAGDLVVDIEWSGISTGTERLLWSGRMPAFPGMGYPLVPGYESVGRVAERAAERVAERAASTSPNSAAEQIRQIHVGQRVFVPGANCFGAVRGLFGGSAARLVVPESRVTAIDEELGEDGVLLALAATALHALDSGNSPPPELIVGHGVLGRLLARLTLALGHPAPMVWETNAARHNGADGYPVLAPDADPRRDYRSIYDVSGDASLLDSLIARLRKGGEIVLAGFYSEALSFVFPPAFMREARIRVAAEWLPADLAEVNRLIAGGGLDLSGLITHRESAEQAEQAYRTAFGDSDCLKMILDWRACS
ncbi:MAG: chlorophyll synthesis pathway protein BchC [Gammaproteobacteria bacterium]|nr:chlorophyll synthesis pathway protein BchC [Gammaproteobacteria bacterium]